MGEIQHSCNLESSLGWQENEQKSQVNKGNSYSGSGKATEGLKQISINDNGRKKRGQLAYGDKTIKT